jgi:flagellar biosynthesis GTPase FlhF
MNVVGRLEMKQKRVPTMMANLLWHRAGEPFEANQYLEANQSREANQSHAANQSREANQSHAANQSREANQSHAANQSRETNQSHAANQSREANQSHAANQSRETNQSHAANQSREVNQALELLTRNRMESMQGTTSIDLESFASYQIEIAVTRAAMLGIACIGSQGPATSVRRVLAQRRLEVSEHDHLNEMSTGLTSDGAVLRHGQDTTLRKLIVSPERLKVKGEAQHNRCRPMREVRVFCRVDMGLLN